MPSVDHRPALSCLRWVALFVALLCSSAGLRAESIFMFDPFQFRPSGDWGGFLHASTFVRSNIQPVREVAEGWHGTFVKQPANLLGFINQHQGVRYQDWEVGYQKRLDLVIQTNSDLAQAYHLTKTEADLPIGASYNAKGYFYGYEYEALSLGRRLRFNKIQMLLRLKTLRGIQVQDVDMEADIRVLDEASYSINFEALQHYDHNLLYDQLEEKGFHADGLSLDWFASLELADQWRCWGGIEDLSGRLNWKNLPYGDVEGTNERVISGNKVQPAVRGFELQRDYQQELIMKFSANLEYQDKNSDLWRLTWDHYLNNPILSAGFQTRWQAVGWMLGYNFTYRSVQVGVKGDWAYFRMEADHYDLGRSYVQGVWLGVYL